MEREKQFRCPCANVRVSCSGRAPSSSWPEICRQVSVKAGFVPHEFVVIVESINIKLDELVACRPIDFSDRISRPRRNSRCCNFDVDSTAFDSSELHSWVVCGCRICDHECFAVEVQKPDSNLKRSSHHQAVLSAQMKRGSIDIRGEADLSPAFGVIVKRTQLPQSISPLAADHDSAFAPYLGNAIDVEKRAMENRISEFTRQEMESFCMFERRARSDARALSKQIAISSLQGEPYSRFKKIDPALKVAVERVSSTEDQESRSSHTLARKANNDSQSVLAGNDPDGDLLSELDVFGFGDDIANNFEGDSALEQFDQVLPRDPSPDIVSSQLGSSLPIKIPRGIRESRFSQVHEDRDCSSTATIIPPHTMTEVPYWSTRIPKSVRARDGVFSSSIR